MPSAVLDRLCQFVVDDLGWEGGADSLVGPTGRSLAEIIDSEELLEMVTFCEEEFGIEIDDEEIVPANFERLDDVARLIEEKQGGTVPSA